MRLQAVPDEQTVQALIDSLPAKQPRRKKKYAAVAAAIAAAAVCSISAASVAVISLYHDETVNRYFPNYSTPEDEEEAPIAASNSRLRVTLDKTLCDGENIYMIFTAEALDGKPMYRQIEVPDERKTTWVDNYSIRVFISPDEAFPLNLTFTPNGYAKTSDEDIENNISRFVATYSSHKLAMYGIDDMIGTQYIRFTSEGMYDSPGNIFAGITLQAEVEKNLDIVTLTSENGRRAKLSQLGFFIDDYTFSEFQALVDADPDYKPSFALIRNDGSLLELKPNGTTEEDSTHWSVGDRLELGFNVLIDTDDYIGAVYDGVQFYLVNNEY